MSPMLTQWSNVDGNEDTELIHLGNLTRMNRFQSDRLGGMRLGATQPNLPRHLYRGLNVNENEKRGIWSSNLGKEPNADTHALDGSGGSSLVSFSSSAVRAALY